MQINNTSFTVRLIAAVVGLLSLLVVPDTYLHAAPASNDAANSAYDTTNQDEVAAANPTRECDKNIEAARTDFIFYITIIIIAISIFLYLLQNKLQELIVSIIRIDESNKKLMEKLNNTIVQMQKDCSEKCSKQESRLNELYKFINDEIQLRTAQTVNMSTQIQTQPRNSQNEIEQWKEWAETALTEYRNLMRGNREREDIKQFRERYHILDIKQGSHGTFEIADITDDNSFLWAMKKSGSYYLVVPSDKFYNDLSGFYANEQRLTHDTFSSVMDIVQQTETMSEMLIKPSVVTLKEGVFTVRKRGELVI